MLKIVVFFASVLLYGPALAQSSEGTANGGSAPGSTPTTQDFVTKAANGAMLGIESSVLVDDKSQDQSVKELARQMIADHIRSLQELQTLSQRASVKFPAAMDGSERSKLDKLQKLDGDDFTKQYIADLISGQNDAVSLFDLYAEAGDNDALRNWATSNLATLQRHLEMAQDLSKQDLDKQDSKKQDLNK
jgi:putative membrane protein